MSWTKHFQSVPKTQRLNQALANSRGGGGLGGTGNNYSSYLPEVYSGLAGRIERYGQYDMMDQDSEINSALDTIATFCTRPDDHSKQLFTLEYLGHPDDSELEILRNLLNQWISLNDFKKRIWRIFRSTIKYGDQFFIRDPETLKWLWVSHTKVEKVLVNEAEGKEAEQYLIRDLDLNLQSLTATDNNSSGQNSAVGTNGPSSMPGRQGSPEMSRWGGAKSGGGAGGQQNLFPVDAAHVVHLSLSEGMDDNWPFGSSILEPVFKVFKQKDLLEDAILIYRVQRAPERRVFYIDVGQMQANKANAHLERVKMEINQRRIPTRTGGGNNIMDAAYNPLSMMEDYFFAQTADGRGSKVETLPGGEGLGQIDDLKYFNNRLMRGLRVPSSYLPTGPEDGQATFNDGRVGTAYIQEYQFACYCQRLQILLSTVFDDEFKLFVKQRGFNITASTFELEFNPPMNFRQFAQIERDTAQINVFQPLAELKYFSKRFLMERFLGLNEEEISRNETLWKEENPTRSKPAGGGEVGSASGGAPGLDSIGFRPDGDDTGGMDDSMSDDTGMDDGDAGAASPISGDEGSADAGGGDNPL